MTDDEIIMGIESIRDDIQRYHERRKHKNPSQSFSDSYNEYMRRCGFWRLKNEHND